MKRSSLNFLVDIISLVDLLGMVFAGLVMKYVLPPGSGGLGRQLHGGAGREPVKTLMTLSRHEWGTIHFYLAAGFTALMLLHIYLHWGWIKSYIKGLFRGR